MKKLLFTFGIIFLPSMVMAQITFSSDFESGLGDWSQGTNDDLDWTRKSGGTPSGNTGPSSSSEGLYYIFLESSAPNYPSKEAIITSVPYDIGPDGLLTFDYHMYGGAMGQLTLYVSTDGEASWQSVWSLQGDQGNLWHTAQIDLSGCSDSTVVFRFTGVTGSNYTGDMSIDNIRITSQAPVGCTVSLSNENYIYTMTPTTATSNTSTLGESQMIEAVQYFDGLGRPIQSIGIRAGGNNEDIVTYISYDEFGRQDKDYLPYADGSNCGAYRLNALAGTQNFYDDPKYENTLNTYSEKHLEVSPVNRVLEQGAPGAGWAVDKVSDSDHTIKFEYTANTESDHVRKFSVSFLNGNTEKPQLVEDIDMVYAPSSLYKTVTKDENWQPNQQYPNDHTTEEYKDKQGRVVLKRTFDKQKWLDTYYVYDDYGNLTYVIPPKAMTYNSVLQPFIQQEFNYDWDFGEVFTNGSGYGNFSLRELDGELDIYWYFGGGNSSPVFKNFIIPLNFTPALPNMPIYTINGPSGVAATVFIQDGNLHIQSTGNPAGGADLEKYLLLDLANYQADYSPPAINSAILNGLCYQYVYDGRNRLVEKKVPGKAWERIVYNKLDQPIMVQDGLQYQNDHWLVTLYDAFGRVAYTGLDEYNAYFRYELQEDADALAEQYVTKTSSPNVFYSNGPDVYYTDGANPSDIDEIYSINYYDDYNFDNIAGSGGWAEQSYGIQPIANPKGLATGSKVRVLDTDDWITTVNYYDEKGRLIYVYSFNDYLDTTDRTFYKLDFTGKVLETTTSHDKIGHATVTTVDKFYYDHTGRLTKQTQTLGGNTEVLVENHYDELGQLEEKGVGGKTSQNRLQTVEYKYNIRGWLKQINDPGTLGNSLFAFKVNYSAPGHGATALYNGNIAETEWRTANTDNTLRWYKYSYDGLSRLTDATDNAYHFKVGGFNNDPEIKYDRNGNIIFLVRNGLNEISDTYGTIDDLEYSYSDNSNQLLKVQDNAGSANKPYGFKDGANTGNDYFYDTNGNMRYDANKGITNILYNHLNLPKKVTFSGTNKFIEYIYDATGVKLEKEVSTGATTEYAGNYVYEDGVLKFFGHPEGYVDAESGYKYVYQYKDHLGNIRLSYSDLDGDGDIDVTGDPTTTEILEENNYYPFGLEHKGYNKDNITSTNIALKRKFGGKEYQDELGLNWYDVTARNYDPALGRWMNLDPLAEQMRRHSPYNYAFDNPIYFIDPDGMYPFPGPIKRIGEGIARSVTSSVNETVEDAKSLLSTMKNIALMPLVSLHNMVENGGGDVYTNDRMSDGTKSSISDTPDRDASNDNDAEMVPVGGLVTVAENNPNLDLGDELATASKLISDVVTTIDPDISSSNDNGTMSTTNIEGEVSTGEERYSVVSYDSWTDGTNAGDVNSNNGGTGYTLEEAKKDSTNKANIPYNNRSRQRDSIKIVPLFSYLD